MTSGTAANYPSLAGQIVVVTGGASGIGGEMAAQFASQGARVFALDIDIAAGQALAAQCNAAGGTGGGTIAFRSCDVTDCAALQAAILAIGSEHGRIDTLVNNAANDTRHDWRTLTPDAWDACMNVNLRHHFFASQAAHPFLKAAGGGSIICLGSISWLNGTTGMVGYTTAKSAIHGLVRTLARLFGPDSIRVNALLPGWTMTERQRKLWVDAAADAEIAAKQALPGKVEPADVARLALFLAAADARMCTQQVFVVDGGWI
ncbi:MAG: SDR family oxidoreductase [Hyphomicrobium sp.]|nr:SDR family oxidoreductase [Hyphomicrobium sp.]